MSSMSFQTNISANLKPTTVTNFHTQPCNKISVFVKPKTSFSETSHSRKLKIRYSSSLPAIDSVLSATEDPSSFVRPEREKLGVVVKPNEKPRLVLKFVWMQNDIGIAIDQIIPGHGTIPLSPYYFWPKKDAWEELKIMLDNKPWISQMEKIHLLNQATDIINLWQEGGGSNA